jgi:hypothetical protein
LFENASLGSAVETRLGCNRFKKLRRAKVTDPEGNEIQAPQCALGIRRNAAGALELLLYGKSAEPLLAMPMSAVAAGEKAEPGITLQAERDDNGGQVTVILFGKYKAKLSFTQFAA